MTHWQRIMRIYVPGRNTITDERLLAAARNDDEDMLEEIFDNPGTFDINFQDGSVRCSQSDLRSSLPFRL